MRRTILVAAVAVLLAGCGAAEPRSLSTSEAERLALIRFTNYEAGIVSARARVPAPGGALLLDGRVDFAERVGSAALRTEGRADPASSGVLQWGPNRLAFCAGPAVRTEPPPPQCWQVRSLLSTGSELDGVLRVLVSLGSDRPDNAQLLQQSSARWLRTDEVNGVPVEVFEGPRPSNPGQADAAARLRYWVAEDGHLHRVEARMGDQQEATVIDLAPGGAPVTVLPQIQR